MSLTEGDKAMVKDIAWEACDTIVDRLKTAMDERLDKHLAGCPYGDKIKRVRPLIIGIAIGFMAAGGVGAWGILKMLAML